MPSNPATLTAGPRAPALGDLRYLLFQQVTAAGFFQDQAIATGILGLNTYYLNPGLGTPPEIGYGACVPGVAQDCGWRFLVYTLPAGQTGLSMHYASDSYSNFSSDMQSLAAPDLVIDSLDLEPANNIFCVSFVKTVQTGGFDYRLQIVPPDQLQTTVANDGAASRIVTAVSFDANNQANVISYGWTGDTTTVYKAQTVIAQPSDVASQAEALAANGYFISAFGGNDTDGYMLIGMRVMGDTLARPIFASTPSGSSSSMPQSPPYPTQVLDFGISGGPNITAWEQ